MILKHATSYDEQIALLEARGMDIADKGKALEVLADIGYYRLGFYWFPFERRYPSKRNRDHQFAPGASFEKAVALYYFDHDLRVVMTRYLHRLEVHFRTTLIYEVSNHFRNNPTWFADPRIIKPGFLAKLPALYSEIRRNDTIKHHHSKYINDKYAPAWKTLEYMTFGAILYLFENLKDPSLQESVSKKMGVRNVKVFLSQMNAMRVVRNVCAHGHNLYDIRLSKSINPGPIKGMTTGQRSSVTGAMMVLSHLMSGISENRQKEFVSSVNDLIKGASGSQIAPFVGHLSLLS